MLCIVISYVVLALNMMDISQSLESARYRSGKHGSNLGSVNIQDA